MLFIIVCGINWFTVGIFYFNIVNWIFSTSSYIGARIVYAIVGVVGLWALFYLIFNKFSAARINAPETAMTRKRKKENN